MAANKDTVTRTYELTRQTAQRVKTLAMGRGVHDSSLVDFLLDSALDAVDAGRLTLRQRPVAWVIDREDGQGGSYA
jgi:hypothetical protein